jgi:hypothetical protein
MNMFNSTRGTIERQKWATKFTRKLSSHKTYWSVLNGLFYNVNALGKVSSPSHYWQLPWGKQVLIPLSIFISRRPLAWALYSWTLIPVRPLTLLGKILLAEQRIVNATYVSIHYKGRFGYTGIVHIEKGPWATITQRCWNKTTNIVIERGIL